MSDEKKALITPKVMLGHWPKLFEKGLPDDSGQSYYETDLLISPEAQRTAEFSRLKASAEACAKEKWPKNMPANLKSPFRPAGAKLRQKDGSQYYPDDQFAGWLLMRVKTKNQPQVVNGKKETITDDAEVYGGCLVRCSVNPNAYSVKGNSGVSFWLNNVQKLGDGPAMSGGARTRAEDDFDVVEGGDMEADVDGMFAEGGSVF